MLLYKPGGYLAKGQLIPTAGNAYPYPVLAGRLQVTKYIAAAAAGRTGPHGSFSRSFAADLVQVTPGTFRFFNGCCQLPCGNAIGQAYAARCFQVLYGRFFCQRKTAAY